MPSELSIDSFNYTCLIGRGTYAKVFLVTRRSDNEPFALKVLKKKYIVEKGQVGHIMTQKQILKGINHPFLVKMMGCFQDQKKLYFVLQYCPGGQLFQYLISQDTISQNHARFYAAQMVLALDQLHKHKIVYRDLKPQNIIIDQTGYLKLTDFGLSKILQNQDQRAQTICGTPQYLAPQIIRKQGHGVQVDWWCLGCLIHQMMTGFPPFKHDNRMKLFEQIIYQQPYLKSFNPKLQDLFKRLLHKDPYKRLGNNGGKQIMSHPWFEQINWNQILSKRTKAPYIPQIVSKIDTSNFHSDFTSCKLQSYQQSPLQQGLQQKFAGFEI